MEDTSELNFMLSTMVCLIAHVSIVVKLKQNKMLLRSTYFNVMLAA